MLKLTAENIKPFIRCVGRGKGISQSFVHMAYDNRFIGILTGSGFIEIEGQRIDTSPYSAFIIPPGTKYRVCSDADQQIVVINFDWTYSEADITETVLSLNCECFEPEKIIENSDVSFLFGDYSNYIEIEFSQSAIHLFDQLYYTYLSVGKREDLRKMQLTSQFMYILTCAVNCCDKNKKEKGVAEKVYSYILSNYKKHISISDVAEHFHYSNSYITKLLRRNYNTSFKQIVIDCRLTKGMWLLENTNLSCEEAAAEVGFYNGQHFAKAFEKKYGKKPTQFR